LQERFPGTKLAKLSRFAEATGVPRQTVTRKLEELPTKFPGTNRVKLSEYVLPWLDLLAWTQREVGEGVGLALQTTNSRLSRFSKTGESGKSGQAEADDPEGEKAGPDPYQMVRAGTARRARTWAG